MRCLLAVVLALAATGSAWAGARSPVVVELFTSQGCSSCPPADAFLAELAGRDDLIALTLHVGYWDYLGWKDTLASKATTERQRAYGAALGSRYVYTPQMVIDGRRHAVGSDRAAINAAIREAEAASGRLVLGLEPVADGRLAVHLPALPGAGGVLWLVRYDRRHDVTVERGENGGHVLSYHNVVREMSAVGSWHGGAVDVMIDRPAGGGEAALLLQSQGTGPILAAARVPPGP